MRSQVFRMRGGGCCTNTTQCRSYCRSCAISVGTEPLLNVGRAGREAGRVAAQSAEAQKRRANSQRPHALARWAWDPSSQPAWLTECTYIERIQPKLGKLTNAEVATVLGSSIPYASAVRAGKRRPHPRHWKALAKLAGLAVLERSAAYGVS
jgi:hypothetical protein